MNDMPRWLKLTVACALLEAKSIQLHADMRAMPYVTREDADRAEAVWAESRRFKERADRARRRATVEAFRAGVIGENWRRVWKPITFSHPMFEKTRGTYAAVDLVALRTDWRAELERIGQFGPQQLDNDPRTPSWRKLNPSKTFEAIRLDDGTIVKFGEGATL